MGGVAASWSGNDALAVAASCLGTVAVKETGVLNTLLLLLVGLA